MHTRDLELWILLSKLANHLLQHGFRSAIKKVGKACGVKLLKRAVFYKVSVVPYWPKNCLFQGFVR
jgi:hypothetical protein